MTKSGVELNSPPDHLEKINHNRGINDVEPYSPFIPQCGFETLLCCRSPNPQQTVIVPQRHLANQDSASLIIMALDAQSNWNMEMSRPLKIKFEPSFTDAEPAMSLPSRPQINSSREEIELPIEIIQRILSYIPHTESSQKTFWACSLVSRAWYSSVIEILYERPYLRGSNFQNFVTTVCPSKNAHIRRSQLAVLVQRLNMGELVHDGSKSLTARLLGRLKGNLTSFVAPQASFSVNSFAALSKCTNLTYLNLSLMSASVPTKSLFKTLQSLRQLQTLFFPRTSIKNGNDKHGNEKSDGPSEWPPKLRTLHLAGGIDDHFLYEYMTVVPKSLQILSIQHCPMVYATALQDILSILGHHLLQLTVLHPMNMLPMGALDHTLTFCPKLRALRISADFISDRMFDEEHIPAEHPLRILDLDCSMTAESEVGISPDSIWIAIDLGRLSKLRSVRVSSLLAWGATETLRRSVTDLAELLEEREQIDPIGVEPGVWNYVT